MAPKELRDLVVTGAKGLPNGRAPRVDGLISLRTGPSRHHLGRRDRTAFRREGERGSLSLAPAERHVSALYLPA
jgi:hypothetical protein